MLHYQDCFDAIPNFLPIQPMSRALVPGRILEQIQLMILFRVVPCTSWDNLGSDLLAYRIEMLFLYFFSNAFCNRLLLRGMCEDRRAVLSANVVALSVRGCGVVRAIEELDELVVRHDRRVKLNL